MLLEQHSRNKDVLLELYKEHKYKADNMLCAACLRLWASTGG